jgi:hypothetical protein
MRPCDAPATPLPSNRSSASCRRKVKVPADISCHAQQSVSERLMSGLPSPGDLAGGAATGMQCARGNPLQGQHEACMQGTELRHMATKVQASLHHSEPCMQQEQASRDL